MKLIQLFIIGNIILFCLGCKNNTSTKEGSIKDDTIIETANAHEKTIKKIFFNLPSPIELTQTILSAKSTYNTDLLNPTTNVKNYATSSKLALNFGVYGADLCYCRVFDQLQESISYLSTIRKISDKLQIPEAEGAETINRIEESIANSDSIFEIISDTYASADSYLKENERDLTATFILIGGWVEGMYFAVNINNDAVSKNLLKEKIAEQKFSMQNLMMLIDEYSENSAVAELHPMFLKLNEIYETISISYGKAVVVTDQETKVTTIDSETSIDITQQQLDEIRTLINEIRSKIIS